MEQEMHHCPASKLRAALPHHPTPPCKESIKSEETALNQQRCCIFTSLVVLQLHLLPPSSAQSHHAHG